MWIKMGQWANGGPKCKCKWRQLSPNESNVKTLTSEDTATASCWGSYHPPEYNMLNNYIKYHPPEYQISYILHHIIHLNMIYHISYHIILLNITTKTETNMYSLGVRSHLGPSCLPALPHPWKNILSSGWYYNYSCSAHELWRGRAWWRNWLRWRDLMVFGRG